MTAQPSPRISIDSNARWTLLAWIAIAVGIYFRLLHLGAQSLWFDEGYSAWMISHPFGEIIRLVKADTSPPLFYLLLRAWSLVFGQSEIALRSFSAFFSIAALLLIYALARRILENPPAIALAMWIAALSFFLIEYAHEARCYSLLAFLLLASFYSLIRYLDAGRRSWLILIATTLTAALYTHNMAAPYALALIPIWFLLPATNPTSRPLFSRDAQRSASPPEPSSPSLPRRLFDGLLTAAIVAAAYLPWATAVLRAQVHMVQQGFWVTKPTLLDARKLFAELAGVRHFWKVDAHVPMPFWLLDTAEYIAVILICAVPIIAIARLSPSQKRSAISLAVFALLPPFAIAIYSLFGTPLFMDKVFLTSSTILPILLLIPAASSQITPRKIGITIGWAALILAAWSLWGSTFESAKEDWRTAAKIVAHFPPTRRLIIFVANDGQLPFDYYYQARPTDTLTGVPAPFFARNPPRTMLRALSPNDLIPLQQQLRSGNYTDVVLIQSHTGWSDPQNRTETLLKEAYPSHEITELHDVRVVRYRR